MKKVAIIGSGPAGLMAATKLVDAGTSVTLFERRPSMGRKLLIAGSSGLNISHEAPLNEFISHFTGFTPELWSRFFQIFSREDWIAHLHALGFETFVGTSSRYFIREMKASNLVKKWTEVLRSKGVDLRAAHEWKSVSELNAYDAVGFFLGGGSWEESPPVWPEIFEKELDVKVHPFYPTNVGYEIAWSSEFLKEAEGKPFKNIVLKTSRGQKAGELVVTSYGIEGTPVYFLGEEGDVALDLKPALTREEIRSKLNSVKENLAPIRRVKKVLQLCDASLALLFHHTTSAQKNDLETMIGLVKSFPLMLRQPRPLKEAISSGGGVDLSEVEVALGQELQLKKHPRFFCGGEMLNWQAPTGGFLIQASVTQGAVVARSILNAMGAR